MDRKEYTTLEQSEELVRLGLPEDNAERQYIDGRLASDTGMMCPLCGNPLVWDSDSDLDPEEVEGFNVVSYYRCRACCAEYEIYQPTNEYYEENHEAWNTVPCWGIAGLSEEVSKRCGLSVEKENSTFVVKTNDGKKYESEELIHALYDALVQTLKDNA